MAMQIRIYFGIGSALIISKKYPARGKLKEVRIAGIHGGTAYTESLCDSEFHSPGFSAVVEFAANVAASFIAS
jgi:hypothetical protein